MFFLVIFLVLFLVLVLIRLCFFVVFFLVLFLVSVFASLCFFLVLFCGYFLVSVFASAGAKFATKKKNLVLFPYKFHALSLILSSGAILDPIVFFFLVLSLIRLCFFVVLFWCYFL